MSTHTQTRRSTCQLTTSMNHKSTVFTSKSNEREERQKRRCLPLPSLPSPNPKPPSISILSNPPIQKPNQHHPTNPNKTTPEKMIKTAPPSSYLGSPSPNLHPPQPHTTPRKKPPTAHPRQHNLSVSASRSGQQRRATHSRAGYHTRIMHALSISRSWPEM